MTALVLSALLVLPAQADDPEPPARKGIVVRLVAKKTTYKLDYGNYNSETYAKAAREGKVDPVAVEMELVVTNHTKDEVRIQLGATRGRVMLKLNGKGVVEAAKGNFEKYPPGFKDLKPGEKFSLPITTLRGYDPAFKNKGGADRFLYWTEPGEYTLTASLKTRVGLDPNGKNQPAEPVTLTSRPITLKVEK
jgi:hypothetical protein